MQRYNPNEIEAKWQKVWSESNQYAVTEDPDKTKKYVTAMFPYPSGAGLHVGHVRNYSITDTIARFHRQKGYNVLTTIGWDAFGLPAENYAIKTGTPPQKSTDANIVNFKKQLLRLGMSYDWSREINTTDPSYYKWTQWIFTQMFEKGLAYQKESLQWWCDTDKTVLANEQVESGKCWRCGNEVVKKSMTQWFFKITDYADQLLDGVDDLEWPEKIKSMQKNWIGKSVGAEVDFAIENSDQKLTVFTTRPDTLFGATFVVLAPENPLTLAIASEQQKQAVEAYVKQAQAKSDIERQETSREKTGVFTGAYAINPVNNEKLPIWTADYVLGSYGTGAIMAVPAHDERDYAFAVAFDLSITQVIKGEQSENDVVVSEGVMINSGEFDGMDSQQAREEIVELLEEKGVGRAKTQYKMRDWLISRQRYWGAPIPIIHCETHGAVPVPEADLPVVLPEVESFEPDGSGKSVLGRDESWVNTTCPTCGGPAKRETDTMDGYACSSWYFLRYTDAHNETRAWEPAKANYWLPIDYYCGGDHAVSHLLYSRFWMHVFADLGLIDHTRKEPVKQLVYNGYINAADGTKMSKSKGNVVDPLDVINQGYGADALRVYELFIAPYELDAAWDVGGIAGTYRFLNRVWTITNEYIDSESASTDTKAVVVAAHKAIKKVGDDLERLNFNTAIAGLMEYVNELYKLKASGMKSDDWAFAITSLVQLVAPFAPHIAEELYQLLGNSGSVHVSAWPAHDEAYLISDVVTIAVQVNGKLRGTIEAQKGVSQEEAAEAAKAIETVKAHLNSEPKRVIFVPNKLLNFVV